MILVDDLDIDVWNTGLALGYFPRIKTFARLQLSDEELDKWL